LNNKAAPKTELKGKSKNSYKITIWRASLGVTGRGPAIRLISKTANFAASFERQSLCVKGERLGL